MHLAFTINGRELAFDMEFDPHAIADRTTQLCLQRDNCCEPELTHLLVRALRPGDIVVDGGANIGFFTLLMATLVGPTGKVLAFEPGENNLGKLRNNVAINRMSQVEIISKPLWICAEEVVLFLAVDSGINALAPSAQSVAKVVMQSTTLNLQVRGMPRLIKLDVEGAEEKVLRGAGNVLLNHVPFVVAEVNSEALPRFDSSIERLCNYMRMLGYSEFMLHPDGSLPTAIPRSSKIKTNRQNSMLLFSSMSDVAQAWPEVTI